MFNSAAGSVNGPPALLLPPPPPPPPDCDHDIHGHDISAHTTHHAFHANSPYLASSGPSFYPAAAQHQGYSGSLSWGPSTLAANSSPEALLYERRQPASFMTAVSPFHSNASALPFQVSGETHDSLTCRPLWPVDVDQIASTSVGAPPPPKYITSPPGPMQVRMGNGLISASPNSMDHHWTHDTVSPHTPSFLPDEEYVKLERGAESTSFSGPTTFPSRSSPASHSLVGATQPVDIPSAHSRQSISSPTGLGSDTKPRHLSKSRTESRQPRQKYLPGDKWETYKCVIRQLYLDEGKPLKEVMEIMKECHGFEASAKMYKTRFSQWGFAKNNTVDEIKKLLAMKFERDARGKVTEFIRNGKPVNLRTYLKRKGVTEYDLLDLASPAELPPHVRCRTPTPPPGLTYLRPPDQLHAQELLVGNMKRAFLHLRQREIEAAKPRGWASTLTWGAGSSDMIFEAGRLFASGENGPAGDVLLRAFQDLELDLRQLSSQGLRELVLAMAHRNLDLVLAVSQYVAAYTTTRYETMHPLRLAFNCLYEVQQKHGASALTDLVWGSVPALAGEMEEIYGRQSPYVTRFWMDLAMLHGYVNTNKLERLYAELQPLERGLVDEHGTAGCETLAFRFTQSYLLYLTSPEKAVDQTMAFNAWRVLKRSKLANRVKGRPNVYCFHSTLRLEPWMKRCKEKYAMLTKMVQRTLGVEIILYFEGEPHVREHADDDEEDGDDGPEYPGPP
ncbi:hypothetical protein SODALDRAFT_140885 [Sodiomyces alkalinus F11]|uniref:Clr5 domain-containing protein n=1 Tax=Sodiomyces alkalinus (strain CBS 110278 / VKM F-3762 / F11) TaxID=1314773 RepID=A0A3N2PZW1_SODAK|nr:hypothetical protein SODALDRAFT_140885 [Sodiomyces alkalinus F11]ROT39895.1 hypothetical protein SODALDRAFT_140885 [Sodiomyces alkalinus F11]